MTNLFRKPYIIPLLITLVGLLAYAGTFSVPFQFDDDAYVVNNPAIRDFSTFLSPGDIAGGSSLSPTSIPPALRSAFMTRILGYLSLAVNYRLGGLSVVGYHVLNLLLHILNAWLLYAILDHAFRGMTCARTEREGEPASVLLPLAAALLFLCHPIQTHAVTYITSRFVLLASFFSLLSLASYIRFRTAPAARGRFFQTLAVLSAALGMLCKEFTFTLPFLIALYEVSFFRAGLRERFRSLAPLALTFPIIPLLVFLQKGSVTALDSTMRTITAADSSQISRIDYLLTQFRVIVLYLRMLIFPAGQNIDHDIPVQHSLASLPVLASLLLLLSLFAWAACRLFRSLRNNETPQSRIIPFGIIWFFVALSVESSIIPLGELQAEYRLYLPSIGVIMAVTTLGAAWSRRYARDEKPFCIIAAILIVALCAATVVRNRVWQSEITLWQDAAAKSPAKVRPHQNLALYYGMQGLLDQARRELQQALVIEPGNFELHNNLGIVYKQMGDFNNAIKQYQTVLKLEPGDAMARYNLGNIYLAQGNLAGAIREYQACAAIIPDYDEVHHNLGIALDRSGRSAEAIIELQRAVNLNPQNANARNNLLRLTGKR
ncbi:tetratricopeptide repeat protein [Geomonas agri]|uniref:tetratricopeptide repeat protein n=1 Tax=Geomonas agri TaxID=2873702 RepID=UPI001CD2A8C0|nr:tetratricopeptide repeat protein [Geomonas agri]